MLYPLPFILPYPILPISHPAIPPSTIQAAKRQKNWPTWRVKKRHSLFVGVKWPLLQSIIMCLEPLQNNEAIFSAASLAARPTTPHHPTYTNPPLPNHHLPFYTALFPSHTITFFLHHSLPAYATTTTTTPLLLHSHPLLLFICLSVIYTSRRLYIPNTFIYRHQFIFLSVSLCLCCLLSACLPI